MKGLTNQRLLFLIATLALFSCLLALVQYVRLQEQAHRMVELENGLDKLADTKILLTQQAEKLTALETTLTDLVADLAEKIRVLDQRFEEFETARAERTEMLAPFMGGSGTLNQHFGQLRLECSVVSNTERNTKIPLAIEAESKQNPDHQKVRKQSGDDAPPSTKPEPGGE